MREIEMNLGDEGDQDVLESSLMEIRGLCLSIHLRYVLFRVHVLYFVCE